MKRLSIDTDYMTEIMLQMLHIPSPVGYTDEIVHFVGNQLENMGIELEVTRRGAIRANMAGRVKRPDRSVVVHLDTLGAMVKNLKDNGRLEISPIGTWSARFAEGARVSIFTDDKVYRGTILPLMASGHTFHDAIDTQPSAWTNVEVRVDEMVYNRSDLEKMGFNSGDYISIDPCPELTESGYINSRHLDDKAGVAALLAAAKALQAQNRKLPVDCHLLFTISEEVGSGASAVLHRDVAEMVTIDNATPAPGQNSKETGVTIAMKDEVAPFDYHLTHKLIGLCKKYDIKHQRDVFRYYKSDSASALEAGNDIRTALICFGVDASHGYERTHLHSLRSLAELLCLYMQSDPTFKRDKPELGPLEDMTSLPLESEDVTVQQQ